MAAMTTKTLIARAKRANPELVRHWLLRRARMGAARAGIMVSRIDEESRRYVDVTHNDAVPLPPGADEYLRADNPALTELEAAYDALDIPAAAHTQWQQGFLKKNLSMAWFRGDNAYVWQFRQLGKAARIRMYLAMLDVESRDDLGLFGKVDEDGLFGAWTFEFGDRPPISRDLLDSINEINYLDDQMGLTGVEELKVLDIGAGYGRLAHRMSAALPNLAAYDCIDGVATSTFLCDYYTKFRGCPDSVRVVRLDEHQKLQDSYDVAVNIHSFSECSLDAIRWWLDRIAERDIEWLLIVPNTPDELRSTELDGSMQPFRQDVLDRGYELVDSRPIHDNDELLPLIDLHDRFYLFRRTTASS
ncbi:class I SAM-dependent methyltransferase [Nocardioides sp. HM23]|uniref:class I SAM-dependent methyltransferase n=1 Tax=Nocardioides bizhenqiangii TaxID=3095076 RepID=UPI002ACAE5CA|nr:class I SAM-dependent methyltransferase [Nocardioides sp. HM23]MDZ5620015.1 class I SAM-dependent methyltransferase [Nocardioides sp. HM23]